MGSLIAPIDFTSSDLSRPESRSFRYSVIEELYSVNIYFAVVFDINLDVTSRSLLAGRVFHCSSGLNFLLRINLY